MESIVINTRDKETMYETMSQINKLTSSLIDKYSEFKYISVADEDKLTITFKLSK